MNTVWPIQWQGKPLRKKIKRSTVSTYTYNMVNLKSTMTRDGLGRLGSQYTHTTMHKVGD